MATLPTPFSHPFVQRGPATAIDILALSRIGKMLDKGYLFNGTKRWMPVKLCNPYYCAKEKSLCYQWLIQSENTGTGLICSYKELFVRNKFG